jgi:HJR/Mrr/RecB family endonuclease
MKRRYKTMSENLKITDYEVMDYLLEDVISKYLINKGSTLIEDVVETVKSQDKRDKDCSINLKSYINEALNITLRDYSSEVPQRYKKIDVSELYDEFYLSMKYEFSTFVKQYFSRIDVKVDISNPASIKYDGDLIEKINDAKFLRKLG